MVQSASEIGVQIKGDEGKTCLISCLLQSRPSPGPAGWAPKPSPRREGSFVLPNEIARASPARLMSVLMKPPIPGEICASAKSEGPTFSRSSAHMMSPSLSTCAKRNKEQMKEKESEREREEEARNGAHLEDIGPPGVVPLLRCRGT